MSKNNFVETRKLRESNDVSMVLISYFFYIYMTTRLAQPEAYSRNHQRRLDLVAKAVSSYETANGSSGVWSFTEAERKICRWPANVFSCCSKVLRSLKDIVIVKAKNLHPLKSHHMKTILLYECEAKPHPILLGFCQWSITDWLTFWRGQLNNGFSQIISW